MNKAVLALTLLGALAPSLAARASVFDSFGYDPRGVGMGGAQVASADDYTASYFNPALLVLQNQFSFGYGISWAKQDLRLDTIDSEDRVRLRKPESPSTFTGWTLGVLFPMGGKVENRLALGVGIYLPSGNILRGEASDPRAPSWYFYQSGPERITIAAGAGARITDWLSIGGGAQILGALVGGFDFDLNLFSKEFEGRSMRADLETRVAPLAGLALDFKPVGVRVGAAYRGAIQMDYRLPTVFNLTDVGLIELTMEGVAHYSPDTFTLGAQWSLKDKVTATVELRYARWSQAPDPTTKVTLNVDGEAMAALGIDDSFDIVGQGQSPGFSDTLGLNVGAEYWVVARRFALRCGYAFRPTPVPQQVGDSNILDGDTHSASLGFGISFDDPLEVFSKPILIEAGWEGLYIARRDAIKQDDSVVPSYWYGGQVNELSVAVRYLFN